MEERVHILVREPGPMPVTLLLNLGILQVVGLVMLFSASYTTGYITKSDSYFYIRQQVFCTILGWVIMLLASRVDHRWWRRWTWAGYVFGIMLLLLALTCEPINECRRWIHYSHGPLSHLPSIQPSEIVKFTVTMAVADLLCRLRGRQLQPGRSRRRHFFNAKRRQQIRAGVSKLVYSVILPLIPLIPVVPLMMMEPHLSGTIVICAIAVTIVVLSGLGGLWLPILCLSGYGAFNILLDYARENIAYVQNRLKSWTWVLEDMTYQTRQSIYAIASGGLTGVGFGNSIQKQLWLPECENDFIFSVICEELGFVGAVLILVLFVVFIAQGFYVAFTAPDLYGSLLAFGIVGQILWQVLFNVGVVTNTLPNTGISLPFFSSGGTSILALLGEMGILLSIARAGAKEREAAAQEEREEAMRRATAAQNGPYPPRRAME